MKTEWLGGKWRFDQANREYEKKSLDVSSTFGGKGLKQLT
jgi:deoxyribodipyrimidine photolyase-like uncharacterized protein